jgi:hypothetical protein
MGEAHGTGDGGGDIGVLAREASDG